MSQSFFFASSYAKPHEPGIHALSLDEDTGEISRIGSHSGVDSPSFHVVHPNKKWMYAVGETGQGSHGMPGSVWSFRFEFEPFSIEPMNQVATRGDWPCHLRLDGAGKWIVATNYGTGNSAVYPIHEDGSLGEMTDIIQHEGNGPNKERQEGPHAHSSIFSPDHRFLIVADLGIDQLVVYSFDSTNGKLKLQYVAHSQPEAGPRHLVFHPSGNWLYGANELNSSVSVYAYDAKNGTLIEKQTLSTIPLEWKENTVADIHVSASAKQLYVSNRGHNSIAVYDIDSDGLLRLVSNPDCGGNWPRNFGIAPGGKFILVANQYSNEVCALPILEGKEALGVPVSRVPVTGASCIQFI